MKIQKHITYLFIFILLPEALFRLVMSKNTINIFNVYIYNQLCYDFNKYLNGLIKYNLIHNKLIGYFTNEEIQYIIEVYVNHLIDILTGKTLSLFIPSRAKKDISKFIEIIRINLTKRDYEKIIETFSKIKNIFFVDIDSLEE